MPKQKPRKKSQLSPGAMLLAIILVIIGLVITVIGALNFEAFGFWWALITMASGLSTTSFAIQAIRTGKQEWILLDLILPN